MRKPTLYTTDDCFVGGNRVRLRDGRPGFQVHGAVLATSKRAAAEALQMSLGMFNRYHQRPGPSWGSYDELMALLADQPLGTIAVRAFDHGDTIDGQEGWVLK